MMVPNLLALTLAVAIGQAPAQDESEWLRSVPADVPVVVHLSGIEPASEDFFAMVEAMFPQFGRMTPQLRQTVDDLAEEFGDEAAGAPAFLVLPSLPSPEQFSGEDRQQGEAMDAEIPAAVLIKSTDYQRTLRALADREDARPESKQGYDRITRRGDGEDEDLFVFRGEGFVVASEGEEFIKRVATGVDEPLARAIGDDQRSILLAEDVGVFVNLEAIAEQYSDLIAQARREAERQFQDAEQEGEDLFGPARRSYEAFFEFAEHARGFAMGADFAEEGLIVEARLAVDEDSEVIRKLADLGAGSASELARLPQGAAYYAFEITDPEATGGALVGQRMSADEMREAASLIGLEDVVASEAFDQAQRHFREAGRLESSASLAAREDGLRGVCVIAAEDPTALIEGTRQMAQAFRGQDVAFIEEVSVEPEAESHQGFTFDRYRVKVDYRAFLEQLEESGQAFEARVEPGQAGSGEREGDPGASGGQEMLRRVAEGMRTVLGQELTAWVGTDGERVLNVAAPSWDEAQQQINAFLLEDRGIGTSESFAKVRERLPERVSGLYLIDAPAAIRQVAGRAREVADRQQIRVPDQMPEGPAVLGFAVVYEPDGIRFRGVVPSEVGPVIEKGIVPMIQRVIGDQQGERESEDVEEVVEPGDEAPRGR